MKALAIVPFFFSQPLLALRAESNNGSDDGAFDLSRAFDLSTVDDSEDDEGTVLASFGDDFFFGLATAAAHVEEAVENDPWVKFAKEGKVAAYKNAVQPDIRLKFWTEPEREIDLAAATGVTVFRLGVEWVRLQPNAYWGVDRAALARYKEICQMVKDRGMKVMLTLFHHSLPGWLAESGGWTNKETSRQFLYFAKAVALELQPVVDYWVTFNEPHVFVLLVHCAGVWPPGKNVSTAGSLACLASRKLGGLIPEGEFQLAMDNIGQAHVDFYKWAHGLTKAFVGLKGPAGVPCIGVAHNVADFEGASFLARTISVPLTKRLFEKQFVQSIVGYIDYLGLNYYA